MNDKQNHKAMMAAYQTSPWTEAFQTADGHAASRGSHAHSLQTSAARAEEFAPTHDALSEIYNGEYPA